MLVISCYLDIFFYFVQNEEFSEVLNGVIVQIVYRKVLEVFLGKNQLVLLLEDQKRCEKYENISDIIKIKQIRYL